jgi:hypothetical protein
MSFMDFLHNAARNLHPDDLARLSATSTPAGTDPSQAAPDDGQPIVVEGNPARPVQPSLPPRMPLAPQPPHLTNGPTPPDLGNRSYVEAARAAVENDRKPKSHLKGILEKLGDAVLINSGRKPMWHDRQEEEDMSNAMQGFTNDPLAAMERMNSVNADKTQEYYKNYQENQYKQGQLKSIDANRQSEQDKRHYDVVKDARITASRMLARAGGDPAKQAAAMGLIQQYAEQNKVGLDELGLHPGMDPDQLDLYAHTDMSGYQQSQVPINQENAQSNRINAEAHNYNAHRPRAASQRQPRAPTEVELATAAANTPPEKRTEAQKIVLEKYKYGTKGPTIIQSMRERGILGPGQQAAPSHSRFRPVK